jgi:hypothetical protein
MAYAICLGHCYACKRRFSFNPNRVPSFRDDKGERQPVCGPCIKRINRLRVEKGMEPFAIPADAYEPEEM